VFFDINHKTVYAYSRPVFLEPQTLRLRPRCDAAQNLISCEIDIEPAPAGSSQCLDLDGNVVMHAWFEGVTESLTILTRSQVQTQRDNPFDYMFAEPGTELLPLSYADPVVPFLRPYRVRRRSAALVRFAKVLARQNDHRTSRFLTALNGEIYAGFRQEIREQGGPLPAEETLARKQGSCRDLAVLFMESCRCVGIAARFVSGYHSQMPAEGSRSLHAWAEVYLPGAGWRGYDPTHGLAVAEQHVALAAAAVPQEAAPVSGHVRGNDVQSALRAEIAIHVTS
jgi:transglutaminase-like putative cysteine protease